MKILQINKFLYPKGGSESYMFALAKALKEMGHLVEFWGMTDERNIVDDRYNCFSKNVRFTDLNVFDKLKGAFLTIYSRDSKKKISIILDEFQPDIIHIHNYNFQLTPSILPEIKKRGIKIVYTAHDSQLVCPYHRLYNFQKDQICTKCIDGEFSNCIKDRCFEGSLIKSFIGSMESYIYHGLDYYNEYVDVIISPSRFLADKIAHLYSKKIRVIPNFIELPNLEYIEKENFVLYFGRVSKEKGIIDILPIFNKMKIPLKIVGNGDEVDNIIESEYIEYLGPKYDEELFDIIRKAKFVIQPSKGYENCPMTVIESFACGTPVIVPPHSGFLELVEDERNGYILDFKDNLIDESLFNVFEKYNLELSQCSKQSYLKYYTKENHLPSIIKVYQGLLNESI